MMTPEEANRAAKADYAEWRKGLPDSRRRPQDRQVFDGPLGKMVMTYCANCHRPYGAVTVDVVTDILVLCQPCAETHGHLPLHQVPPELERALRGEAP